MLPTCVLECTYSVPSGLLRLLPPQVPYRMRAPQQQQAASPPGSPGRMVLGPAGSTNLVYPAGAGLQQAPACSAER